MIKKFTVDRSKWLRGEGSDKSRLYRKADDSMCCLGFFGQACGLTKADMDDHSCPEDMGKAYASKYKQIKNDLLNKLMTVNDSWTTLYSEGNGNYREIVLKRYFAEAGIEVEFVN